MNEDRDYSQAPRRSTGWALSGLLLLLLIGAWQLAADAGGVDPLLVASPLDVMRAFADDSSLLASHTWVTTREALVGILAAIALGTAAALILHLSDILRRASYPLLIASQSVPVVVIAPILVIWLGYGIAPKILLVVLVCFFPVIVNVLDGLRSADPEMLRLMHSLGSGRLRTLLTVEAPGALPAFFTGARIAATWAFIGAVFAEYAGSTEGLGYLIARGTPTFETARVYAAVLILAFASLALYGLLGLAERKLIPWAHRRPAN